MTELLAALVPGYVGGIIACWITLMLREPRRPLRFLFVAVFWPYYFFRIIVLSRFDF